MADSPTSARPSIIPRLLEDICERKTDDSSSIVYFEFKEGEHSIAEAIFLRSDALFRSFPNPLTKLSLTWLTISQCKITFEKVTFNCKIQVTAGGTIRARKCRFTPIAIGQNDKCECAVEIFASSYGEFTDCFFGDSTKTAIAIRDRSDSKFTKCTFQDNLNTSILVLDHSTIKVEECTFESNPLSCTSRFSIYLYRSSQAEILNSHFLAQIGKGLFMLSNSKAKVENCTFSGCKGGAISVAEGSFAYVSASSFTQIGCSSIHAMKSSTAHVNACNFTNCQGNGVNFEYSSGYVLGSTFSGFDFPAIACFGSASMPIICNVQIEKCKTIAIVSRDCATPIFHLVRITDVESHGFSISDFSKCIISECFLKGIKGVPFCAFNGAAPTIQKTSIDQILDPKNRLFELFTCAELSFSNNEIKSTTQDIKIDIHNYGSIAEFESNILICDVVDQKANLTWEQKFALAIQDDQLIVSEVIKHSQSESPQPAITSQPLPDDNDDPGLPHVSFIPESAKPTNRSDSFCPPKSLQPHFSEKPRLLPQSVRQRPIRTIQRPAGGFTPLEFPPVPSEITDLKSKFEVRQVTFQTLEDELDRFQPVIKTSGEGDAAALGMHNCGPCLHCNEKIANYVCSPCGHKVLCRQCAANLSPSEASQSNSGRSKCPLCTTPIQRCCEEFVEDTCVICLDHTCNTIILPCGHRCICYNCATSLWAEKKQCPLCQARVLSFRYQFPIYSQEDIDRAKHFPPPE